MREVSLQAYNIFREKRDSSLVEVGHVFDPLSHLSSNASRHLMSKTIHRIQKKFISELQSELIVLSLIHLVVLLGHFKDYLDDWGNFLLVPESP